MAFVIRVGSLTVVARTASEAVEMVDRFGADTGSLEPVISTFEGAAVDVDELRLRIADIDGL